MDKYVGVLKEFSCPSFAGQPADHTKTDIWVTLFLTAGKYGVKIITSDAVDLNHLLSYQATERLPITRQNCSAITWGKLDVTSQLTHYTLCRLSTWLNLSKLAIHMHPSGVADHCSFLSEFKNLRELHLSGIAEAFRLPNLIPTSVDLSGLPSVEILSIKGDVFDRPDAAYSSFASCFPNLVKLSMTEVEGIPDDFFVSMAKCCSLTDITLDGVNCTDEMFTQHSPGLLENKSLLLHNLPV